MPGGGGALAEIPVEGGGDRRGLADADGLAGVGVPGVGRVGAADEAVVDLADDLDGVGRGALLGAHLDELAGLVAGGDDHGAFGGVVAAGLLDVDVLAGLYAGDGHGGVPVVGRGDGDGVDIVGGEDLAEVLLGLWSVAQVFLGAVGVLLEDVALDITDVGDLCVFSVGLEGGEMGVGAAVEADDGEVDAVVGAEDAGVAAGGGGEGGGGGGGCGGGDELAARDHGAPGGCALGERLSRAFRCEIILCEGWILWGERCRKD